MNNQIDSARYLTPSGEVIPSARDHAVSSPGGTSALPPTSSASDSQPLSKEWSDMEAGGLIAFLDRMINGGGSADSIAWAKGKLEDLLANSNIDDTFRAMTEQALSYVSDPAHPDKDGFNQFWVVSDASGAPGPVSTVWSSIEAFSKDPSTMVLPDDDGTALFAMISLFADFSSSKINKEMVDVSELFFGDSHAAIPPEVAYGQWMALYLSKQTALSASDLTSIAGALPDSAAAGDPESATDEFFDYFSQSIAALNANNGIWPDRTHPLPPPAVPYPTQSAVEESAQTDWYVFSMGM